MPPVADQFQYNSGYASHSNQCSGDVLLNSILVKLNDGNGGKEEQVTNWLELSCCGTCFLAADQLVLHGGSSYSFDLLEHDTICEKLPRIPNGEWIDELKQKNIDLKDVGQGCDTIDILLGKVYWGNILTGKIVKLSCGLVATNSIFGESLERSHVRGVANPAYFPPLRYSPRMPLESKWWEEPSLLMENRSSWPSVPLEINKNEVLAETVKFTRNPVNASMQEIPEQKIFQLPQGCSRWGLGDAFW
ncbi:unnamed protein product [Orchesella dallaii]|uniref:Uncharacterized protein n=1 Tax=Orchesella dallaii TaxID=48710 RepID=A0ABP1S4C8_9HEXA